MKYAFHERPFVIWNYKKPPRFRIYRMIDGKRNGHCIAACMRERRAILTTRRLTKQWEAAR